MLKVACHHAKSDGAWISPTAWAAKNFEFFVCVSVMLVMSRLWTTEFVCTISPWRHWNTETILIPLDRGRFIFVHRVQLFQIAANWRQHKMQSPKNGKLCGFSPPEGDRINHSRQNLACKHRPQVCFSTPNLALIGKGLGTVVPPNVKICLKLQFFFPERWHSKRIQMRFGMYAWTMGSLILPNVARIGKGRWAQESSSPKNVKIWSKLRHFGGFFAPHGRHNTPIQMKLSL